MAKAFYDGDPEQWVDFKEPTAPISMADILSVGGIGATFGEKADQIREWVAKSIAAWQMNDAYGQPLDAPSADAILCMDFQQIKFITTECVKATIEIPLASSRKSPSANS